ncbi:MAG: DEAD/DEAH box helicase family protein [Pyrinomonadaceae bacterium MAG19_C2-C3]|nr:DEAD/DEAH box helicase family protein [Pyrinomonadaceae bacterium MAG19_C2-C3]
MNTQSANDESLIGDMTGEVRLRFDAGTLILEGVGHDAVGVSVPRAFAWDERVRRWRAPAHKYRQVFAELVRSNIKHTDDARGYHEFDFIPKTSLNPRPYQHQAIEAWRAAGRRGVVVLPTGAGKTLVAEMAIADVRRSTLIIVPTIDLMNQWYDVLLARFDAEIGLIGGGYFEIGAITITTYSSAFRIMERLGNKFGLLIFDECHHLPSDVYRYAAELSIAPFRLGLTATPERADEAHHLLDELIGATVLRREAQEFAGEYLADYKLVRVAVELTDDERVEYDRERIIYRDFLTASRINFASLDGWQHFVMLSARSEAGRRAMFAYRQSKRIALGTEAKLIALADIFARHPDERLIVFTAENEIVYRISSQFLIPAITHETPIKERRDWLHAFNAGEVLALATSKVLNEGVNIPEASVAVVLSGSGSTREHIQRLGRILRPAPNKQAVLYEVVTTNTAEERISERRSNARQFQTNE